MNNYQNSTNFIFSVHGELVKDITGLDKFECNITTMPTPEVMLSSTTYGRHPLASKQKGKDAGNVIENDDVIEVEVLVDQTYQNYLFFLKWLASYTTVFRSFSERPSTFVDIIALNDKKEQILVFQYKKVIPNRLSQIIASPQLTEPDVMVLPVALMYDEFSVTDEKGDLIIE